MDYKVVYDALEQGHPLEDYIWVVVWFLGLVMPFFLLKLARSQNTAIRTKQKVVFITTWIVFWGVVGGIGNLNVFLKQSECQKWLKTGDYIITEGIVEQFDPMPYSGHKHESFVLNGYKFEYSDFDESKGCFNNTFSHGGPIYEGRKVRIYHKEGIILRIEVPEF